jgi:hypothetical protein
MDPSNSNQQSGPSQAEQPSLNSADALQLTGQQMTLGPTL